HGLSVNRFRGERRDLAPLGNAGRRLRLWNSDRRPDDAKTIARRRHFGDFVSRAADIERLVDCKSFASDIETAVAIQIEIEVRAVGFIRRRLSEVSANRVVA